MGITENRAKRAETFEVTMNYNNMLPSLKKAIYESTEGTEIVVSNGQFSCHRKWNSKEEAPEGNNIIIDNSTTLQALRYLTTRLKDSDVKNKVAILNFASATTVGGGTAKGANAQEESICRVSTLYPVLNSEKVYEGYYMKNRLCKSRMYEHICVYTPDVIIFREDGMEPPEILPEVMWMHTDVITCPAPNLRKDKNNPFNKDDNDCVVEPTEEELRKVICERLNLILYTAVKHGVTHIILGAFGCGAFRVPPEIMADEFYKVLIDSWMHLMFKEVIFAIPCDNSNSTLNHDIFKIRFSEYMTTKELQQEYLEKLKDRLNDLEETQKEIKEKIEIQKDKLKLTDEINDFMENIELTSF